jgi:hypothetical protein
MTWRKTFENRKSVFIERELEGLSENRTYDKP